MRVLIIGANGQIGKQVAVQLKDIGQEPVAMIRKEEQKSFFESKNIETIIGDLEYDFNHAFRNIDSVLFVAGSGGNTGADKTIIIDQEGAIESQELAKKHGVKRFVLLSSMRADNPKAANEIKHYLYAKHRADVHLQESGLDYTILRPGALTNDSATGKVNLHEGKPTMGSVPRADVAHVLVELLNSPETKGKVFNLIEGETPISSMI